MTYKKGIQNFNQLDNHFYKTFVYGPFTSIFLRPLLWYTLWRCILNNSFELGTWDKVQR